MPRSSKFSTKELLEIVHRFFREDKHKVMKTNFINLAKYASSELGYLGLEHYHFGRNKEVNQLIKDYKKTLKSRSNMYLGEELKYISLDVKEFVKNNVGNVERLTFYLTQILEGQKHLYDRTLEAETKVKKLEFEFNNLDTKNREWKQKYDILKEQYNKVKQELRLVNEALNIQEEQQLLSALNSTGLIFIESNKEVATTEENIKNLDDNNGKNIEELLDRFKDIFE